MVKASAIPAPNDWITKSGTIINEFQKADRYEIDFNGIGLASGVYIYRMKINDFIESKKMLLIR